MSGPKPLVNASGLVRPLHSTERRKPSPRAADAYLELLEGPPHG